MWIMRCAISRNFTEEQKEKNVGSWSQTRESECACTGLHYRFHRIFEPLKLFHSFCSKQWGNIAHQKLTNIILNYAVISSRLMVITLVVYGYCKILFNLLYIHWCVVAHWFHCLCLLQMMIWTVFSDACFVLWFYFDLFRCKEKQYLLVIKYE